MKRLRILIWHVHGSYLDRFARAWNAAFDRAIELARS